MRSFIVIIINNCYFSTLVVALLLFLTTSTVMSAATTEWSVHGDAATTGKGELFELWLVPPQSLVETEWITELLSKVERTRRSFYQLDDLLAEFESRSTATTKAVVLVISGENDRTGEMMSPKKALKAIRKRVNPSLIERLGVVQLSEEYESRLRLYYPPLVDFSFRNYWFNAIDAKLEKKKKKGKLNQEAMIHWFPLGHTHKFQSLAAEPTSASDPQQSQQLLPATQREYFCSFVGSVNDWKPSRIEMIQELSNTMIIDHRTGQEVRCFIENTGYEFAGGRNKSEYSKLLHETAISLCPAGTNPEQFRIWESLEAGAIPILTKGETFSKLPPGHPLIIVDNWNGIAGLLSDFASDPDKLLAKQQETRSWWLKFKEEIKNKFRDAIG